MEDWIFWVGAGVSANPPTNLPVGNRLAHFSIDRTCGEPVRKRIEELWRWVGDEVRRVEPTIQFYGFPRLESVLGAFADAERGAPPSLQFLRGFISFAAAPYNPNHLLLASLVRCGATVITTNFDLAVERALEKTSGKAVQVVRDEGMLRSYQADGLAGGQVIHVHGVADNTQHLGATLAQVKRGIAEPFRRLLEERLDDGAVLIFVGYSASDAFDVTPYFASRRNGVWSRSRMVFAQHEGFPIPLHVEDLSRGFGGYTAAKVDTTSFLRALSGLDTPTPDPGRFEWEEEFSQALEGFPAEEARPLLTCALANTLGINVDHLDPSAFDTARATNPGYVAGEYYSVLAHAARNRGEETLEADYFLLAGGEREDLLGYYFAKGQLLRAWRLALPVREILRHAGTRGAIPWKPYTSLSVHARILLLPFVRPLRFRPIRWALHWLRLLARRRMERLAEVAALLADRDLADVVAIHQVATALRLCLLFTTLQDRMIDRALERKILTLYSEQANLAGFVSSFRDFALSRLLLLGDTGRDDVVRLINEAEQMLERSRSIARLIGDATGERRADQLLEGVRRVAE